MTRDKEINLIAVCAAPDEKYKEFRDGDIVYNRLQKRICIYHHREDETPCVSHCRYNEYHKTFEILDFDICISKQDYRLATEEEKQKLFDAIKNNGYMWNAKTKTLEKLIVPKFKKGDKIRIKFGRTNFFIIKDVCDTYYELISFGKVDFTYQDNFELVTDKFDINTLKPFYKVLVRCNELEVWHISFFEKYDKELTRYPFVCINGNKYSQCIPYKDNEYLLDTADNCDDFYKNW